jgi:hypothetical protein
MPATAKLTTDRIVSRTVHVCSVCLTVRLKNFEMIQKPPSLTWLAMIEPAAMDMAINATAGAE